MLYEEIASRENNGEQNVASGAEVNNANAGYTGDRTDSAVSGELIWEKRGLYGLAVVIFIYEARKRNHGGWYEKKRT